MNGRSLTRWSVICACVLVFCAGCAGSADVSVRRTADGSTWAHPTVKMVGLSLPGTLYLLAGPNGLYSDVYRVRGSFAAAQRLTFSTVAGITGIDSAGGRVVLDDARSGVARLRVLLTDRRPIEPGPVIARPGYAAVVNAGGRFAFASVGGYDIYVGSLSRPDAVRLAFRGHGGGANGDVLPAWGPNRQLAVEQGIGIHARMILGVGAHTPRVMRPHVPGLFGVTGGGPGGVIALQGKRVIGLLGRNGRVQLIRTEWQIACFDPNGRDLLVISPDDTRLGLMKLSTHVIAPIASVTQGELAGAAWLPN